MLLLREWYMHPNGQIPAYEWAFGDVNPPVHAWAAWRVYKIEQRRRGRRRPRFLERVFHKLLLNFTWWVNRKDAEGQQRLRGRLPGPGQHRGLRPLAPAADGRPPRAVRRHGLDGDVLPEHAGDRARAGRATTRSTRTWPRKFFEHFVYIAHAMNDIGGEGIALGRGGRVLLRRAPLPTAARRAPAGALDGRADPAVRGRDARAGRPSTRLPGFQRRMEWFLREPAGPGRQPRRAWRGPDAAGAAAAGARRRRPAAAGAALMLDEDEFLSPHGIRSLSRLHLDHPYVFTCDGRSTASTTSRPSRRTALFGGNSNWRGPIWFPVNYLLIEALQQFHHFFGDELQGRVPDRLGPARDALGDRRRPVAAADADLPARTQTAAGRSTAATSRSRPTRTGATSSCSTSTSTATPAPASAPATRPAGPRWWPSSSSKAGSERAAPQSSVPLSHGAPRGHLRAHTPDPPGGYDGDAARPARRRRCAASWPPPALAAGGASARGARPCGASANALANLLANVW